MDITVTWSLTPGMTVVKTSSRTIAYSQKPESVVTTSPTA